MPLAAGARLGAYEIQSVLGAGGMGQVYRAHDTELDRDIALKVLRIDDAGDAVAHRRLLREARAGRALEPSIHLHST
jgi:serine/threonine protein kinase